MARLRCSPLYAHLESVLPKLAAVLVAVLGFAYFLPFALLGEDSYFVIHDNLDGEFVYKYLLATTGQAFNFSPDAVIANVMNGIPRAAYPSALSVPTLLFFVFEPHTAYIVNHVLVHTIAFAGMLLLLKRHFLPEPRDTYIAIAVAACFFLVPFYTAFGLSVAGQPLLAYAFLNILRREQHWSDYAIIVGFALYSSMVLVAPFIVTLLLIVWLVDAWRTRRLDIPFLCALALLCLTYLLVEFQMISSLFIRDDMISHREAWNRWTDRELASNARRSLEMLLSTQYHTGRFPTALVLAVAAVALVVPVIRRRVSPALPYILAAIVSICLVYGFYDWFVYALSDVLVIFKYFNASRFYFLLPTLLMLLFALGLRAIATVEHAIPIVCLLLSAQVLVLLNENFEYKRNVELLLGRKVEDPTYREFFSPGLFSEIADYIGLPKQAYKVVSIGMHPSIAQFNGFYTLDGYQTNYPLAYKLQFRRIIARELSKNAELLREFDEWGNRCYLYVAELGRNFDDRKIAHLELDTAALKALGGSYILSANEIVNFRQNGLVLEKVFSGHESYRQVYLYRVSGISCPGTCSSSIPPLHPSASSIDP